VKTDVEGPFIGSEDGWLGRRDSSSLLMVAGRVAGRREPPEEQCARIPRSGLWRRATAAWQGPRRCAWWRGRGAGGDVLWAAVVGKRERKKNTRGGR
jgi:hypothetical protein